MRLFSCGIVLVMGLLGCATSSNFGTAKMARAGGIQVYPHATFYHQMADSAETAVGILGSYGGSLVYGFSHQVNVRAKYERAILENEGSIQKLDVGTPTANLDDHVLALELKLSLDGLSKAASIGFQRFQRSGISTMTLALYFNGYFRDDLYMCMSPYFYVVTYKGEPGGFSTLAGNISLTYEFRKTLFIRPELGTSLVFPEESQAPINLGLAAGLMF